MRPYAIGAAFVMIMLGVCSFILRLTGLQFSFMNMLESTVGGYSILVYLGMIFIGAIWLSIMMTPTTITPTDEKQSNQK